MAEEVLNPKTPQELYDAIPDVTPSAFDDLFEACKQEEVREGVDHRKVFKVRSQEILDTVPTFAWDNIFAAFKNNPAKL